MRWSRRGTRSGPSHNEHHVHDPSDSHTRGAWRGVTILVTRARYSRSVDSDLDGVDEAGLLWRLRLDVHCHCEVDSCASQ